MRFSGFISIFFLSATAFANGTTIIAPPNTDRCQDLVGFSTQRKIDPQYISSDNGKLPPFETDGLLITQNGKPVYEWYDGVVNENTPHILWSASKDVTAALLGRVVYEKYKYRGQVITLKTPLSLFFPNPPLLATHPEMREQYEQIQLHHLIEMSANFNWKEYYDSDISDSSFMPMLYTTGHADMAQFALEQPINPQGAGGMWNYSGGNINILMAIFRKVFGAQYEEIPYKLLFDPLGITTARIEKDLSGNFVGSSYIFMSVRDMAKFGQLLLQNGVWNGKRLLPSDWVQDALKIEDSVLQDATPLSVIKENGVEGRRVAWLNRTIYQDAQGHRIAGFPDQEHTGPTEGLTPFYPQEMPQAPGDMYFAAGHYGQLVIVIPSHNMVIARTGYDLTYWTDIQPLVVKALSCAEPQYEPYPVKDLTPPNAGVYKGFFGHLEEQLSQLPPELKDLKYIEQSGVGQGYIAVDMCAFLFLSGAESAVAPKDYISTYMTRSGFPSIALKILNLDLKPVIDVQNKSVTVYRYDVFKSDPTAPKPGYYDPVVATLDSDARTGCTLH